MNYMEQPVSIAPLVTFRIAFGLLMLFSTIRYMALGWVDTQLVDPVLHFKYFGFAWVPALGRAGMYAVFGGMALASIGIALGWYYRLFTVLFFLSFTYVELIDITYYLNHYYFVSIVAFLLIWVPAHRYFSLDVRRQPEIRRTKVSRWCVGIFKVQIAIVYIYAGLAKMNPDWLFEALPLSIWLPAKTSLPFIGSIFQYKLTAYLFSWLGMLFDTFIIVGLLFKRTRWLAYIAVIIFHTLTGLLFQIGIFPIVMIFAVTIFFSPASHERVLNGLARMVHQSGAGQKPGSADRFWRSNTRLLPYFLSLFIFLQLIFPWRYLCYPGNLFWTEEGYRFSWRVMLMEKAGTATFYVKDSETGREGAVINHQFLNPHQEKQMAMQPDLIVQYAHYLKAYYAAKGLADPSVRAEVWVTLNGRPAQLLIDPAVDLSKKSDTWSAKDWILPYKENTSQ
ncbi:MAG TPA: HTTM domain-containing protein [Saprospiraceae bacterium]|nr:HTTM domain-containing protein [Saprospiraceae bacterium]